MTKSAMIRARIDPNLKTQAESVLKEIGLSTSELMAMTFRQVVLRQGLPFEARIPNAETIAALQEDVSQAKVYAGDTSFDEMMADILTDSD